MSGGHFDYDQYRIGYISDAVEKLIISNDDESLDEWGETKGRSYPPAVIAEFHKGLQALRVAQVYAQRIDWLVSGDDGEDSFIKRLERDLKELSQ